MQNVRSIRIVLDGTVKMNAEFAAGAKNHYSVNSPHFSRLNGMNEILIYKCQLNSECITQTLLTRQHNNKIHLQSEIYCLQIPNIR